MPTYSVEIPKEKQVFFEELLDSMGFKSKVEDFELDEETKKMLDERLENYYKNPIQGNNFSQTIKNVRAKLLK